MAFDLSLFRYQPTSTLVVAEKPKSETTSNYLGWSDDDLSELFGERAAMFEFAGGLTRLTAEQEALNWLKSEIGERRFKIWDQRELGCAGKQQRVSLKVAADQARPATVSTN